jgi:predicted nucleotidyltransferase component of viral defense system
LTKRDLGASVRERLLNQARAQERPFQELLQYYAMERFLYRLSRSRQAEQFILKGALLLTAWRAPLSRSTMDIDLLGRTSNELEHVRALFTKLCNLEPEPDGIEYDAKSVKVTRIKEDADYEGVRVRFRATLARARISMQIDIGFGDVVTPGVVEVEYPTLLEFSPPVLRAYPKETVVAEKLEALTALGTLNSRMKDYFDLWALSRLYVFDGPILLKAIKATFARRATAIEAQPVGLEENFANDEGKSGEWNAFIRRSRLADAPARFMEVVVVVRNFAYPLLSAAASGAAFNRTWQPGGPWTAEGPK